MKYWLFRDRNYNSSISNNEITYGWSDFDLSACSTEESKNKLYDTLREWNSASHISIVNLYLQIQVGDIVVLPYPGHIAIGEVVGGPLFDGKKERYNLDKCNYFKVNWKLRSIPRSDLSSDFQTTLKYRKTLLQIYYYENEINAILSSAKDGKFSHLDNFRTYDATERERLTISLFNHISDRKNLNFQDNEFEQFVLSLLEIGFNLKGFVNSKHAEFEDGRDLIMHLDYQEIGIAFSINVQVKQHSGETGISAIDQIAKAGAEAGTINIVATNAVVSEETRKYARSKNVQILDGWNMAKIIVDNIEGISEEYLAKLRIHKSIVIEPPR